MNFFLTTLSDKSWSKVTVNILIVQIYLTHKRYVWNSFVPMCHFNVHSGHLNNLEHIANEREVRLWYLLEIIAFFTYYTEHIKLYWIWFKRLFVLVYKTLYSDINDSFTMTMVTFKISCVNNRVIYFLIQMRTSKK